MKSIQRLRHPIRTAKIFFNYHFSPLIEQIARMAQLRSTATAHLIQGENVIKKERAKGDNTVKELTASTDIIQAAHYPRVALGPNAAAVIKRIRACLDHLNIPYFLGGGPDPWSECFNIREDYSQDLWAVMATLFEGDISIAVRTSDRNIVSVQTARQRQEKYGPQVMTLLCVEKTINYNKSTSAAVSWIFINSWKKLSTYSADEIYELAVTNPFVKRIRKNTFDKLCHGGMNISEIEPAVTGYPTFPIDVVFTWVDGSDEEWKVLKGRYTNATEENTLSSKPGEGVVLDANSGDEVRRGAEADDKLITGRAHHEERFRNRDELKYALRSIEMFAPFVRHVFLVTNGQVPSWLDTSCHRITVVTHSQIYGSAAHTPTFNSSSIETQLHHIEGLSEHFLYFNDDFFLGDFCTPLDFFLSNGVMKYFPSDQRLFPSDIDRSSEEYIQADYNAAILLKKKYGTFTCEIMQHAPYPSRRSLLNKLEYEFQEEFDACASSRFRSARDLRPIAFMQYHAGLQEGVAIPSTISNRYLALWKSNIATQLRNVEAKRAYKTFCINDVGILPEHVCEIDGLVVNFLETYFPFKSKFEK